MDLGPLQVAFVGGDSGPWKVGRVTVISGASLPPAARVAMQENVQSISPGAAWVLRGVTGRENYATLSEVRALAALPAPLGRRSSTAAAMIPIRKSAVWWKLSQGERRAIFEERSHHIAASIRYTPRIARRLHHCRNLGEPFDFVTWFEYSPSDEGAFDELVDTLRATEEWSYVEREVDIRLTRTS